MPARNQKDFNFIVQGYISHNNSCNLILGGNLRDLHNYDRCDLRDLTNSHQYDTTARSGI